MASAVISSFFVPPSKKYFEYIDLRVICLLLSLMLVVAGLKKVGVFGFIIEYLLKLVHNIRSLSWVLVYICFFSSMFITNDVALITFVPLAITTLAQTKNRKLMIPIIALQTVAANLGSMLTPLGNPQNLYLYSISNMTFWQFLRIMAIPSAISFIVLTSIIFLIKPESIAPLPESQAGRLKLPKVIPWIVLFIVCLLAVLHIVSYGIALIIVIIWVIVFDKTILLHVDYGLLLTFAFLFIFIGNIKNISAVSTLLSTLVRGHELTAGILLSQVISNVPAAMLLSKFTVNHSALLVGVNLGGLGTLIASMASVISYKFYTSTTGAQTGKYLAVFTVINLLFLGILWLLTVLFIY